MNSRRQFLGASAALLSSPALRANPKYPYTEFEQRIARKDFRGMTKEVLPTPCMVVDIDLFEKNLKISTTMQGVGSTSLVMPRKSFRAMRCSNSV